MLSLVSLIILMIGGLNWFCIGALQYDFVAGLFGSQANIFSRLVYIIVGLASIAVGYFTIKNKGKIVSFRKIKDMLPKKEDKKENNYEKQHSYAETDEEYHPQHHKKNQHTKDDE